MPGVPDADGVVVPAGVVVRLPEGGVPVNEAVPAVAVEVSPSPVKVAPGGGKVAAAVGSPSDVTVCSGV